ncbi:uncharacterized protein LOC126741899 [Anthonomus grandis grandis]|uniref:uncharacterized protein LOC126741899 n=1 Tax=Anthonomus grandis grandis TaxID=2921223 RepID=UPI002165C52C|nr:uncharacterized protein LOC126741899 [Anthonomus grandis grandis]
MYIASASSIVKFYDFPSNQLVYTYQPKYTIEGPCRSLSWAKDGNWIAVVPYTGCTEIVTLKDQCKLLHTVQDIPEPSCASFQNLTKRNIVVGTKQGQILLYDIKMKSVKARYPKAKGSITHVGFTAKDTHCFAGCSNGDILLFNNVAKNMSCSLRVPKSDSVTDVKAHSLKRNFIMAGSNDGIVCVWDVNVNKVKFKADAHTGPVSSVLFHPQNVMLVVSAGSDRSVRIFDIESHTRVNKIAVENNVLSIDFLDNSLYLVMGTQNGKILIYDTRSLREPVNSLDAHSSAVKHLLCQNSSENSVVTNSSSLSSFVADEAPQPSKSTEELPSITAVKKRTSDVFGYLVQAQVQSPANAATPELLKKSYKSSLDCGDSFLNALGLDKNTTLDSEVFLDEGDCHKLVPTKEQSLIFEVGNTPKTQPKDSKIQTNSTPFSLQEQACFNASPIIPNCASTSVTQVQNVNSEYIKTEIKQSMEQLETKLSYLFMDHAHQIRKMILDLHMATMKEFIKVEDRFLMMREDLAFVTSGNGDNLIEENMNLKLRVEQLENELARIKVKDSNANS